MKKLAIVLLAAIMLALSGCGTNTASTNGTITIKTTTNTPKTTMGTSVSSTTSSTQATTKSAVKTTVKTTTKKTSAIPAAKTNEETVSFEEGKKLLVEKAENYMQENGIDPSTAGETGEVCSICGKKIWDPDKYGIMNPGYPDGWFSDSCQYCSGGCGITVN